MSVVAVVILVASVALLPYLGAPHGDAPRGAQRHYKERLASMDYWEKVSCVGSHGAVVSAALSKRKVAGSIPTIGDFHTVGPCKKAVFACLATHV